MSSLPGGLAPITFRSPGIVYVLALVALPVRWTWEESASTWFSLPAPLALVTKMIVRKGAFGAKPVDLLTGAMRPLSFSILLFAVSLSVSRTLPGMMLFLLLRNLNIHHDSLEIGQLRLYQH